MTNQLTVFEGKNIRSVEYDGQLWFSVVDIIEILTNSASPRDYWTTMKRREPQMPTLCRRFKLMAADAKMRETDCADTEGVLRIIQSVPSPKAEPFKMWLAGLGKQALIEEADPELGFDRLKEIYKSKGYSDEWIERRLQSIETRKQLTDEWQKRGIREGQEYAVLTATIAKNTFGLTPTEHKAHKNLEKPSQNLRDHMTPLELIFTALGEEATRQFATKNDAQGFAENHDAAEKGGIGAGTARQNFEKATGLTVLSAQNFLELKTEITVEQVAEKIETPPQ
jgi:DNA-damage-inducible protein D